MHTNDEWAITRVKQAWPVILLLVGGIIWVVAKSQKIDAQEMDIADVKSAQLQEIEARKELFTQIQELKQDVAVVKESVSGIDKHSDTLEAYMKQILNIISK